jgi:hypothetical protein
MNEPASPEGARAIRRDRCVRRTTRDFLNQVRPPRPLKGCKRPEICQVAPNRLTAIAKGVCQG